MVDLSDREIGIIEAERPALEYLADRDDKPGAYARALLGAADGD